MTAYPMRSPATTAFRRTFARVLGLLGSERSQVVAFTIAWCALVVLPMVSVIAFSFLRTRGVTWIYEPTTVAYVDIIETGRWVVILRTLALAGMVTAICLVIGYPFALWLAKRARSEALKQFVFICMTVPFFLDPSARTLVWRSMFGSSGMINTALLQFGIVDKPLEWLLFSDFAVGFGTIAPYFPNMVWPIYLSILLVEDELVVAARDLGAGPFRMLRDVVLPLSLPGIIAGIVFTFVPVMGENVVTRLLGGGKREYLADSVGSLVTSMNYGGALAFATIILAITALLILAFMLFQRRSGVDGGAIRA